MDPTIRISKELVSELNGRKVFPEDTHEDVLWDLLEQQMRLSAKARRSIARSLADIRAGRVISHEELKKQIRL